MNNINFWHRVLLPDGSYTPGIVFHGPDGGSWPTTRFGLPVDLTGKTVIDVGAWDGFFSFEAEKRGAKSVLAVDCGPEDGGNWAGTKGFTYIKRILNSKVDFYNLNIENTENVKTFPTKDIVLCYGVLYHLKSPLVAMENLARLTAPNGMCLIETAITDINCSKPILEYRPKFENDPLNFYYPNNAWVLSAAKEVGFSSSEVIYDDGARATYKLIKGT